MGNVGIKVPGVAGKIEARALRLHNAVVAGLDRVMAAKRPKPKKPARRAVNIGRIRDYREVIR
jgi:hypothetical protein